MKRLIFPNVSLYRNTLIPRMIFWQGKTEETQNTLVWPGMVANSNASFRQWTTNWKSDVKHFGKIWWVTGWLLRVHSRTWLMTSHFSVIVLDEGQSYREQNCSALQTTQQPWIFEDVGFKESFHRQNSHSMMLIEYICHLLSVFCVYWNKIQIRFYSKKSFEDKNKCR